MSKQRRKWDSKAKLSILKEAKEKGVVQTARLHDLYPSTIYDWQKSFKDKGEEGLSNRKPRLKDSDLARLVQENNQLKLMLAEEQLKGRMKDELIKKKHGIIVRY